MNLHPLMSEPRSSYVCDLSVNLVFCETQE